MSQQQCHYFPKQFVQQQCVRIVGSLVVKRLEIISRQVVDGLTHESQE